ncbi:uridine kinase [Psychromonas sp. RZ22]|nr:uridine kinase [Psychromonas sp. RZ22]
MKTMFNNAAQMKSAIKDLHNHRESKKAQVIAISGIEGSGKRSLTEKIAAALRLDGLNVAVVHTDDWEASKEIRFNVMNSPEEYYLNAYRFDEMFEQLILPLKLFGSIKTSVNLDDAESPRQIDYNFEDIDIILIEGVYLIQEAFLDLYDYSCWVKSNFDTAFKRLAEQMDIEESQEALVNLFEMLIKPAGQYHIYTDDPIGNSKSIYLEEENTPHE